MKIIILGAGQVGGTLAENLSLEDNDIILVDLDAKRLHDLHSRLDIGTITGHGAYPKVLQEAGIETADMLIAVTNSDEVNLIACQVAHRLFHTPKKIARIRARDYLVFEESLFDERGLAVDVCISPESLLTQYFTLLVAYPGALQVLELVDNRVQLVALKPYFESKFLGKNLMLVNESLSELQAKVVAIYRNNHFLPLADSTVIELGDELFFIAPKNNTMTIITQLRPQEQPNKRIMIAGGGHIGLYLAEKLENAHQVKLIDRGQERVQMLASQLEKTVVLWGDASDSELLLNENIENIDVFCAVTNEDEVNIMSSLQAKRLGVKHAIALINRSTYVNLVEGGEIDIAVSPQQITTSHILRYLRQGNIIHVSALRRGGAQIVELIVSGDKSCSKVVGRTLLEIQEKLAKSAQIITIFRGNEVILPDNSAIIESDDRIILLLTNKKHLSDIERLFHCR